ncbi:MAG: phosphate ABC transporter permease PstA [Deltaproteobacteria bacterium]|nr:phosphate ABC transporter permease PstA [Deltaproteobacteria bacterium]
MNSYLGRKTIDIVARSACLAALLVAIVPLAGVLFYLGAKGISGLSWGLFTELPKPVGEPGGGFANAIVGTVILVAIACSVSLPVGVFAGVYLAEFGGNRFAKAVRFSADVLSGVPSIAVGVFAYTIFVLSMRRFSALAGGFALSIIMLPTITRTTEELIKLVPDSLREAGLALGIPKWRVIISVVLRTGAPGITTGIMLAVARAAGETAPLLFTALNNRYWSLDPIKPIASLPVQIYTYAISPFDDWHRQAWAAALVLVAMVLVLNILARLITYQRGGER